MLAFAAESIITNGVGVIILFASEVSGIKHISHCKLMPSSIRSSWPV
jgi:hypothetical protein